MNNLRRGNSEQQQDPEFYSEAHMRKSQSSILVPGGPTEDQLMFQRMQSMASLGYNPAQHQANLEQYSMASGYFPP